MASSSWEDFYNEVESGSIVAIPEGSYDVTIDAIRMASKADVQSLFLDLTLQSGANAGKTTQASLCVSELSTNVTDFAAALVGQSVAVDIGLSSDGQSVILNEDELIVPELSLSGVAVT